MYKIIKDNTTIGFIDEPVFIKQLSNGNYTPVDKKLATGIVFDGNVYAINDNTLDGKENVTVVKMDSGSKIYEIEEIQTNTDEIIVDQEYRLTLLELGVTE